MAVTALRSSPSSSAESGRAATLRAEKKVAKYERIMLSVGGIFRAGVVERFGAVGDSLAGWACAPDGWRRCAHGR